MAGGASHAGMMAWYGKLPTWAKIAIPVVIVGIFVFIWAPWSRSSGSGTSTAGTGLETVPAGGSPSGGSSGSGSGGSGSDGSGSGGSKKKKNPRLNKSPIIPPPIYIPGHQVAQNPAINTNVINLGLSASQLQATQKAAPIGKGPTGNTPFASQSRLQVVAKAFGLPMTTNTRGKVAVFYAGKSNNIPQIAKYGSNGQFLGVYAAPTLKLASIGSLAGGVYRPAWSYAL